MADKIRYEVTFKPIFPDDVCLVSVVVLAENAERAIETAWSVRTLFDNGRFVPRKVQPLD